MLSAEDNSYSSFDHPGPYNRPFPHQVETLKEYPKHARYGDFSDPGTGKTFPAQIHAILMAALGNKVVFTMPPKLIRQFETEFHTFLQVLATTLTIDHFDVGAVQKEKWMQRWYAEAWPDILLISYEVPTSPKDAKQAIARCDRNGQQHTVNIYFPRVVGTLLDLNFQNMLKNERQNNKVVRDTPTSCTTS